MYHKTYSVGRIWRILLTISLAALLAACATLRPGDEGYGLVVGAVVNDSGLESLKGYERWRYADQIASHILGANPHLEGHIDSYQYAAKRVGKPFSSLIASYRLEGDLSRRALEAFQQAELRRSLMLLVTILPGEEKENLDPKVEALTGNINNNLDDYYDVEYQTIRTLAVRAQVYDTASGRKVFEQVYRSDDNGKTLANERSTRKYVGNSVLAALSNAARNGVKSGGEGFPPAPKKDDVLTFIWSRVGFTLPGELRL